MAEGLSDGHGSGQAVCRRTKENACTVSLVIGVAEARSGTLSARGIESDVCMVCMPAMRHERIMAVDPCSFRVLASLVFGHGAPPSPQR